jgi:hypothetical protein
MEMDGGKDAQAANAGFICVGKFFEGSSSRPVALKAESSARVIYAEIRPGNDALPRFGFPVERLEPACRGAFPIEFGG